MKMYYVLFALMLAAISGLAQTESKKIRWSPDDSNCDKMFVEGREYRIIRHGGVTVASYASEDKDFYAAEVMVINNSSERIDVDPRQSFLVIWKESGKPGKILDPLDPAKIAKKIERRMQWATGLRSFGAAMATKQQTVNSSGSGTVTVYGRGPATTGTYSGSGTSVITSPDETARQRADAQNSRDWDRAQGKAYAVESMAMKANTLFTNQDTIGEIYFPHEKFHVALLVFKVNGVNYEFAVSGK